MNNAITASERIRSAFKAEYVGPAKGRISGLKERLVDKSVPAAESQFRSDLQDYLNDAIFQITGKQVGSIAEAERILGPLPNVNLPASTFRARMTALEKRLTDKRKNEEEMAKAQRLRSPGRPQSPSATPPADAGASEAEKRLREKYGIK